VDFEVFRDILVKFMILRLTLVVLICIFSRNIYKKITSHRSTTFQKNVTELLTYNYLLSNKKVYHCYRSLTPYLILKIFGA